MRIPARDAARYRGYPRTPVLDSFNSGASQALSVRSGWSAARIFGSNADFTTDSTPTTAVSTGASDNTWGTPFTNGEVWATWASVANEVDLYARWSGPSTKNGYSLIWVPGPQFYIVRIDAGVNTTISSVATQSLSAGDTLGLRFVGSTIVGWYKAAAAAAGTVLVSASDATYSGSGAIGVDSYSAGNAMDAFGGGAV